jgi:hypothetical protein
MVDQCAPVKISSRAEYSILQVLQFQEVSVCCMSTGEISFTKEEK